MDTNTLASLLSRSNPVNTTKVVADSALERQRVTVASIEIPYSGRGVRATGPVDSQRLDPVLYTKVVVDGGVYRSLTTGKIEKAVSFAMFGFVCETDDNGNVVLTDGEPTPTGEEIFIQTFQAVRFTRANGTIGDLTLQARISNNSSHGVPMVKNFSTKHNRNFDNVNWSVLPENLEGDLKARFVAPEEGSIEWEIMNFCPIRTAGQKSGDAPAPPTAPQIAETAAEVSDDPF